jgi:hypothetical protein
MELLTVIPTFSCAISVTSHTYTTYFIKHGFPVWLQHFDADIFMSNEFSFYNLNSKEQYLTVLMNGTVGSLHAVITKIFILKHQASDHHKCLEINLKVHITCIVCLWSFMFAPHNKEIMPLLHSTTSDF